MTCSVLKKCLLRPWTSETVVVNFWVLQLISYNDLDLIYFVMMSFMDLPTSATHGRLYF